MHGSVLQNRAPPHSKPLRSFKDCNIEMGETKQFSLFAMMLKDF